MTKKTEVNDFDIHPQDKYFNIQMISKIISSRKMKLGL